MRFFKGVDLPVKNFRQDTEAYKAKGENLRVRKIFHTK